MYNTNIFSVFHACFAVTPKSVRESTYASIEIIRYSISDRRGFTMYAYSNLKIREWISQTITDPVTLLHLLDP